MKGKAVTAFTVLVIIVVGSITVGAVAEETNTVDELSQKADATYGEGNWSFKTIYCQLSCAQAPRPVTDSVPNASVKVGATEEDAPPYLQWPFLVVGALITVLLALSIGLYRRYRDD